MATIGVIGGGQLARMMVPPAIELGIAIRVLAEAADSSASIAATAVGDFRDTETVLRFAEGVDVVTFDHEHVPQDVLAALEAAGVTVRPGPAALLLAQDKLVMRRRLGELGVPLPEWAEVGSEAELEAFRAGRAVVVKTPRGGYDGKGVRVVREPGQAADRLASGPLLAEELVGFRRELARLIARRPSGEFAVWPVVETVQRDGVCAEVIAPAPGSAGRIADMAADIAITIAERLEVTGVLAVELFETDDDRILVNELAMRPHNSGHWSIDGSTTSQFEQHLRAVLDLPLGGTASLGPWSVMVNVLGGPAAGTLQDRYPRALADQPDVKFHAYGKAPRPGRRSGTSQLSATSWMTWCSAREPLQPSSRIDTSA